MHQRRRQPDYSNAIWLTSSLFQTKPDGGLHNCKRALRTTSYEVASSFAHREVLVVIRLKTALIWTEAFQKASAEVVNVTVHQLHHADQNEYDYFDAAVENLDQAVQSN